MIEFSTFVDTTDRIDIALKAGATHLILEHPNLSKRTPFELEPNLKSLEKLISHATSKAPKARRAARRCSSPGFAPTFAKFLFHFLRAPAGVAGS